MKISILLPYKENFSPEYPGAVSLFVKDTLDVSRYKKKTTIFGSTDLKKIFKFKYKNIPLTKIKILSSSNKYVNEFIKLEKKNKSNLIEIHNRPNYLRNLKNSLSDRSFVIFFHNDPLTMKGSKKLSDRKYLLKNCFRIIFNSNWSKKRFLEGMDNRFINSEKLIVIYQSALKQKIDFKNKKKEITFVGKLNKSKGYDIFGKAVLGILKKNKNWKVNVIGDEQRDKISFEHKNLTNFGFLPHNKVLGIYRRSSIAVVCSRWEEPFGRTSLEASAAGCAVIISNRGGLPETVTNAIILKKLSVKDLYKAIENLIINKKLRLNLQKLSNQNFYLTHSNISKLIDKYRDDKFKINSFFTNKNKQIRILHITNFNERHDGRLFFNTGRRINNGFIRLGHSNLEFSDRDILHHNKTLKDFKGTKTLNEKLRKTCYNYKPDLIVLGHADSIDSVSLGELKDDYPNLKIAQWFLDPLNKKGPDYLQNVNRILDKSEHIDSNFITTSPDALGFLSKKNDNYFIPNPSDPSFETLNNFRHSCNTDVFFALSHGVHRGKLKSGKYDDRAIFLEKLLNITKNVKFELYGLNKMQPIWADHFFKIISSVKMGLNLSRGEPIKYYSSDRITQIIGNGLVTLIDEKTLYRDFFNDNEMVFYKNVNDLSEKINRISTDEKLRKKIAYNGKKKYTKYFNSTLVAEFIINKTLGLNSHKKYLWHK
jgi:glycosyltransferase involved in cell wall biosynthesis